MTRGTHTILTGDVLERLRDIPRGSVQCCVTSPPYWALRSYLPDGHDDKHREIGSEKTPEEYIGKLVEVFRAVRDVLRDDATLWLNLGDSYASGKGSCFNPGGGDESMGRHAYLKGASAYRLHRGNKSDLTAVGLKPGDLCNMPHRVAEALQADGWYWRSTIIWYKKSPMPESISGWRWLKCRVKVGMNGVPSEHVPSGCDRREQSHDATPAGRYADNQKLTQWQPCPGCDKCRENDGYVLRKGKWRPTNSYECVFMLSKSERYFCDGDAVAEIAIGGTPGNKTHKGATAYANGDGHHRTKVGLVEMGASETRNPRSVWTLSSEAYRGAHFATFPSELVKRCILAGTSAGGCCEQCGASYAPVVASERVATRPGNDTKVGRATRILGYKATCRCDAGTKPSLVLDPFLGSGTTAQVATWYGRDAIGIELNPVYVVLAQERIATMPRCLIRETKQRTAKKPEPPQAGQRLLW
jgi:site-specific DNA-methyltransferase (cytosine-N4-specific)